MPESSVLMTQPSTIAHYRIKSKLGEGDLRADIWSFTSTPRLNRILIHNEALIRVVEVIYCAGLTGHTAAGVLGANTRTVNRDWAAARPWLQSQLAGTPQ